MNAKDKTALVERVRKLAKEWELIWDNSRIDVELREIQDLLALCDLAESPDNWISVEIARPPVSESYREKNYVLAVDDKNRMSVGYAVKHSTALYGYMWTFAKPIGNPTHWQPLATGPKN